MTDSGSSHGDAKSPNEHAGQNESLPANSAELDTVISTEQNSSVALPVQESRSPPAKKPVNKSLGASSQGNKKKNKPSVAIQEKPGKHNKSGVKMYNTSSSADVADDDDP